MIMLASPRFYDEFLKHVDPWRRELERARKQLSKLRNQPKG
jgi:hypothetical protein